MDTLSYLRGRRLWVVPEVLIWGKSDNAQFHFITVANIDGQPRASYCHILMGGETQEIFYSDLVDFRGNNLPASISHPKIIIQPRSSDTAFLVGAESNAGFRIARSNAASGAVKVDLFIYEMG